MIRNFDVDPARDVHIAQRIIAEELSDIVRWALLGASRLLRQGGYTLPLSHHLALAEWRRVDDRVRLFLDQCTRPAAGDESSPAAGLYKMFMAWAKANHVNGMTDTAFGIQLNDLGIPHKRAASGVRYAVVLRSTS